MSDYKLNSSEMVKDFPLLLKGPAKQAIEAVNKLDMNHDGKSDLAQLAAVGAAIVPILAKLNDAIDFEAAAEILAQTKAVKNKALFAAAVKELGAVAEKALPHSK